MRSNANDTVRDGVCAGNAAGRLDQRGLILVKQHTPVIAAINLVVLIHPNAGQVGTGVEGRNTNGGDTGRDGHRGQSGAAAERIIVNGGDAVSNGYIGQTGAVGERLRANGCDAFADGYVSQTGAVNKRIFVNGSDVVADGHAGEAMAITECPLANGGNRIATKGCGNDDVAAFAGVSGNGGFVISDRIYIVPFRIAIFFFLHRFHHRLRDSLRNSFRGGFRDRFYHRYRLGCLRYCLLLGGSAHRQHRKQHRNCQQEA